MLSKMFWTAHRVVGSMTTSIQRKRRALFLLRLRLHAIFIRTELDLQVADDVVIGRRVRIQLSPNSKAKLVLSRGVIIHPDAKIYLHSGEVLLGPATVLRSNSVLNIHGRFEMGSESQVSWGSVIHCGGSVTFGSKVGVSENCTVADSYHYFTEPNAFFYNNTRHSPVVIGDNTWLATGVTVTSGVTIGDHCIIGAGAVVSRDVPSGHVVSAPKSEMRDGRLRWNRKKAEIKQPTPADPPAEIARILASGVPE
jgi:UDP-3-O-[3-hydroxymyristoyl] glucosamine N-acyltransferase